MILKKITIKNFRNHQKTKIDFTKKSVILIGENGAGKTSLIEAIYTLATIKPFRNPKKKIFIKNKENYAKVSSETNHESLEIYWEINPKNRIVFKKDNLQIPVKDFLKEKQFFAVLFSPEDLNLPFLSPRERRRYLTRILAPISTNYFTQAIKFEKILKSRNRLLQRCLEKKADKKELEFWDLEFIKLSQFITDQRQEIINFFNQKITNNFQQISHNKDILKIKFKPNSKNITQDLKKNFQKDLHTCSTNQGAHRDDFVFYLRNQPLTETGSRGEIRSAILALKIAEKSFLQTKTKIEPLLLFDDVFSELDIIHKKALFKIIKNNQVILSCTDVFANEFQKEDFLIYEVKEGKIFEKK